MRQRYRTTPERITETASIEAMLAEGKREEDESWLFSSALTSTAPWNSATQPAVSL
jgi:hypothetical protein